MRRAITLARSLWRARSLQGPEPDWGALASGSRKLAAQGGAEDEKEDPFEEGSEEEEGPLEAEVEEEEGEEEDDDADDDVEELDIGADGVFEGIAESEEIAISEAMRQPEASSSGSSTVGQSLFSSIEDSVQRRAVAVAAKLAEAMAAREVAKVAKAKAAREAKESLGNCSMNPIPLDGDSETAPETAPLTAGVAPAIGGAAYTAEPPPPVQVIAIDGL